nr:hypothetical protein [Streptomyces dioscori]
MAVTQAVLHQFRECGSGTVWRAVHGTTGQPRFPAGPDVVRLAQAK